MKRFKITNDILINCGGEETIYSNPVTKIEYTSGVRDIAKETNSYWFLDIIASYQKDLKGHSFQVWKLERDLSFTMDGDIKNVVQRKNSFKVYCEDGNDNIILQQHISFSDFKHDLYIVWSSGNVLLLPREY